MLHLQGLFLPVSYGKSGSIGSLQPELQRSRGFCRTKQWQREMKTKFSLNFDLIDRAETHLVQRHLGLDANHWRTFPRIIASYYSQTSCSSFSRHAAPRNPLRVAHGLNCRGIFSSSMRPQFAPL